MKLSETIKTIFAWIGLILIIPSIIGLIESEGLLKILFVLVLIILFAVILRWRQLLNYIKNTESIHFFTVINKEGDVLYENSISILPLLWQLKTKEVFMSLSGKAAKIDYTKLNCPIDWTKKEEKAWHGVARLNKHRPRLFSFGSNAGTRLEVKSLWKKGVDEPPFDFVVTCGPKKASRIVINVKWCKERAPSKALCQIAPFPTELLIKKKMINTTEIPWMTLQDEPPNEDKNGDYQLRYNIEEPKKLHLYRVYWKKEDEPK